MGAIDVVILLVAVLAIIRGGFKGLIKQLGSLVGIVLGVIGCNMFGGVVTSVMADWFPSLLTIEYGDVIVSMMSHILLFLVIYWAVLIVAKLFKEITSALQLGFIDKILGSVLCVLKYILVLSVVLNIWMVLAPTVDPADGAKMLGGDLYRFVYNFSSWLLNSEIVPYSKDLINSIAI